MGATASPRVPLSLRPLHAGMTLRSYRLERPLGVGGAGEVWLARDTRGREVAIKARPRIHDSDEQHFREEFEKLRTLSLPSVVRVLDTGTDQGYVFFTMEVAHGQPFHHHVGDGRSLAQRVERLAQAGEQVARALAGIHRLGMAHRDVKPANVLVDDEGRVTVLDFGTLRFGAAADSSSEFMGTVAYMAPEQRVGLPHDHRVDAFALGVTLHEALSGVPASRWKPGRPRTSLALLGPEVPLSLACLVDRLLSLDPAERPTAEECESLLGRITRKEPLPPAPWPSPQAYAGNPAALVDTNALVVGPPGSGRRRLVQEARWAWYRRGYRSIAGRCRPAWPFGALLEILAELFIEQDGRARRELAGEEAPLLKTVWPELPLPDEAAEDWPPDPVAVGQALARVMARREPLAIVLWDLDQADAGTASVVTSLVRAASPGLRIWATSERSFGGLPELRPPAWGADLERVVLADILPPGTWPEGPPGATPLASCAKAWQVLARWRGEPPPLLTPGSGLAALTVLAEPFPRSVAEALAPDLDALIERGSLTPTTPLSGGILRPATRTLDDEADSSTHPNRQPGLLPARDDDTETTETTETGPAGDDGTIVLDRAAEITTVAPAGVSLLDLQKTEILDRGSQRQPAGAGARPRLHTPAAHTHDPPPDPGGAEALDQLTSLVHRGIPGSEPEVDFGAATEILPTAEAAATEIMALGLRDATQLIVLERARRPPRGEPVAQERADLLVFADRGTWLTARAQVRDASGYHARAALAWEQSTDARDRALKVAEHALHAGVPAPPVLDGAIAFELDRDQPAEVDRWLRLKDLLCGEEDDFITAYARLYVELELRPTRVKPLHVRALRARASTRQHKGMAAYLQLILEARQGDRRKAIARGHQWVHALAERYPVIAASMLREVALARLRTTDVPLAVHDGRRAVELARQAAASTGRVDAKGNPPLTQAEVTAGTTLSAALIYTGQYWEAAELCGELADRCHAAGMARGEGALRTNLAYVMHFLGFRQAAAESAARARAVQVHHHDPVVLANCALVQARLAVELGQLRAGRTLLEEALTAAQSIKSGRLQAAAWTVALEAALHAADLVEGRRALATYGIDGVNDERDHWPAVHARWKWMVGDLDGALAATRDQRTGYADLCVRAERARLLLVSGQYREASRTAREVVEDAQIVSAREIGVFARLVSGAAKGQPDADYMPLVAQTRSSRWVHLYLGALHLDAIRRQLRGENVLPLLKQLRARAGALGHRLYEALARTEAW